MPLELAILLQLCGDFGQPAPDRDLCLGAEPRHQPPFQGPDVTPAFLEQDSAAAGQRPLQHPAVHGMRRLPDRAAGAAKKRRMRRRRND